MRPLRREAEHLWKERQAAYADTHATLETGSKETEELAEALLNAWSGWQS